jgi:eukaryotic-like serine/threonine-protein kinase
MQDESKQNPLHRLSEAVAAFLEFETKQLDKEDVLGKHDELRDLLEPMFEDHSAAEPTVDGDKYLGEHRLVREIGRGGMGVVYEAEDVTLGRRVALKVLPPHLTQNPRQIERFRREAAAAARLEHPGIVPVFSVGEASGSHYFAMEYVAGPSLHQATETVRHDHASFASGFGGADLNAGFVGSYVTQCVEIVAQVAEALTAAHEGSVIHRDIKPHNLLLADSGRVRVVDFGLAKDLDRATISQSKEVAGTPHYMSPEQISGLRDVDHRTDIYAAGVVLYELLSLRCPFDANTTQGLLLSITTKEPSPLRKLSPRTPRDVEIICLKAMEKDPAHRYQTAAEFGADLRRFLNDEPIIAQPPSSFTRILKLVRRRRAASVAVALALLLPVLGAFFYYEFYRPTSDALALERTESVKVQLQGEETFRETRKLLSKNLTRAVELARRPGMLKMSRAMMEEAMAALVRLKEHKGRFPGHSEILGQIYLQVGAARFRFGEGAVALADFERGYALLDELAKDHPNVPRASYLRARALSWLGLIRNELGQTVQAEQDHRDAIAVLEAQPKVGEGRVAAREITSLLTKCYVGLGISLYHDSKRLTEAIEALEHSLVLHASLPESVRDDSDTLAIQIDALRTIGRAFMARGNWKRAAVALIDAKKVCLFAMARDEPPSPRRRELGRIHFALGRLRQSTREDAAAIGHYKDAVAVFRAVHNDFPEMVPCQNSLARCLRDLGLMQGKLRRTEAAEQSLSEAVKLVESISNRDVLIYQEVRGSTYAALARLRSASVTRTTFPAVDALFEKAITILEALVPAVPSSVAHKHQVALTMQNHVSLLLAVGEFERARDLVKKAIGYQVAALEVYPKNSRFLQIVRLHYFALAEAELQLKNHKGAAYATKSALLQGVPGMNHLYVGAKNYARCAALASADDGPAPLERDELVNGLGETAVELLGRAIEKKAPLGTVQRDPAFSILHERADWKELLNGR